MYKLRNKNTIRYCRIEKKMNRNEILVKIVIKYFLKK